MWEEFQLVPGNVTTPEMEMWSRAMFSLSSLPLQELLEVFSEPPYFFTTSRKTIDFSNNSVASQVFAFLQVISPAYTPRSKALVLIITIMEIAHFDNQVSRAPCIKYTCVIAIITNFVIRDDESV